MKKMDKDGLLLCELQAKTFETSLIKTATSSEIFIRRFMNSEIVKLLDSGAAIESNLKCEDILLAIEEQYHYSNYGSVKYDQEEMYWIGYIYRYYSYTYEISSLQAYKKIKPKELRSLYFAYHTLSPTQAIERILEAKGLLLNEEKEFQRQLDIFKKIRKYR